MELHTEPFDFDPDGLPHSYCSKRLTQAYRIHLKTERKCSTSTKEYYLQTHVVVTPTFLKVATFLVVEKLTTATKTQHSFFHSETRQGICSTLESDYVHVACLALRLWGFHIRQILRRKNPVLI